MTLTSPLTIAAVSQARASAPSLTGYEPRPRLVELAFLILLVLAPLPLGSNRPAWWSLLGLGTAGLTAIYLVYYLRHRPLSSLRLWQVSGIFLPVLGVILWATFQALPGLRQTPLSGLVNPLWPLADDALGLSPSGAISLNPHETMTGVLRLLTYALVFWLALELGRDRPFANRLVRWIAYAGLGYAAYGLGVHMMGIERILWLKKWAYFDVVTSTFVNRNSYATYAALGLLCALALLVDRLRVHGPTRRTARAAAIAVIERLSGPGMLPLIAAITITVALLQTGSRAGALSTVGGLFVFAITAASAKLIAWRRAFLGLATLGLGLVLILALHGGAFVDRLDSHTLDQDRDARAELYALTYKGIKDDAVLGTGLGTFPEFFSLYRDASFDTLGPIDKAHSSYLGNALELGLPASLLLLAGLAAAGETAFLGLRRRRRGRLFPVLGLSVLTVGALHSTVDFSLEIPAVTVTFAALMGVACAQSYRTPKRRTPGPPKLTLV